MPRAHRHRVAGQVWHITHRCHRKQFLLRFARDRRVWVRWLYEARRRFELCVLDYQVTSNHVHLLVLDQGRDEIAASMQLIAGRTGQQYNRRKKRRGAFWEDRYHATAVDREMYLARCIAYIDLNMVRAGVVAHPREWMEGGYHEIQRRRRKLWVVDRAALSGILGIAESQLASAHAGWIESEMGRDSAQRVEQWSEAIAVGRRVYVEEIQRELGARALYRRVEDDDAVPMTILRERALMYAGRFAGEKRRIGGQIAVI